MLQYSLEKEKKVYFASDFHLGAPNFEASRERESTIIAWLETIKKEAQILFLVGDIFDLWFEFKNVVPKGSVRFLGKLAELADAGIEIHYFGGNHDMWHQEYLVKEIGLKFHSKAQSFSIENKKFFIHHGHGLGTIDRKYSLLNLVFESKICNWLFRNIMPAQLGMNLGLKWAKSSWKKSKKKLPTFEFEESKQLVEFSKKLNETAPHDYFIFGHWHLMLNKKIGENAAYINLGDWINLNSYAVFDGKKIELLQFQK